MEFGRGATRRTPVALTPLVDVVFILLVFFMLAFSFTEWRAVELLSGEPDDEAALAGDAAAEPRVVFVRVLGPRGLDVDGVAVSESALRSVIAIKLASGGIDAVLVRPVGGVEVQRVVWVLDELSAAGVRDVSLVQ